MSSAGWENWKLSHAYRRIGSGTTPTSGNSEYYDDELGTPWITTSELREKYISRTSTNVTESALNEFSALRVYEPNSVLIAMYGATIGRLGMSSVAATCNQACCVFEKSDRFDNRFLFYWLWHRRSELIALSVGGGQPNLSQQDLRHERALCPPLDIQQRIAAFLDEKTAQIDALIAKKQGLLERLAEKRQAIITQAVTKGLNPAAPMKPSGIDWLGEIPAHWEVKPIYTFQRRITYGFTNPMPTADEGPFMLTANDIDYGQIRYSTARRTDYNAFMEELTDKSRPKANDVLITKDGSLGRVAVFDGEMACINQSVALLRVMEDLVDPNFLARALNSAKYQEEMILNSGGTTIKHIYITRLAKMPVALPPRDEQKSIALYASEVWEIIQKQLQMVTASIELIDQYRSALITAAVTGQMEI